MNVIFTVESHKTEYPLTYNDIVRKAGVYEIEQSGFVNFKKGRFLLVLIPHQQPLLLQNDVLLYPFGDGWKNGKYRKVENKITITLNG